MQKTAENNSERLIWLDMLRGIACLSVIMIHVSAEFVIRGSSGPDFWVGNLWDSLSRAGVPLFVMISGALMLDGRYRFTREKWLGHIGRMMVFYAFWKAASALAGSPDYHLWFVPMIIGLYLLVPLLRLWVCEKNLRCVEYYLILSAALAFVLPQLTDLLPQWIPGAYEIRTFANDMHLSYAGVYPAYFILGWYLNRGVQRKGLLAGLGVAGILTTFAGTGITSSLLHMSTYPFYENYTVNVLLHAVAVFVLCRAYVPKPEKADGPLKKAVLLVGKHSLGIYAVHLFVISRLMPLLGQLHAAIAIPLIFLLTAAISWIVSLLLHYVPLLKKIV